MQRSYYYSNLQCHSAYCLRWYVYYWVVLAMCGEEGRMIIFLLLLFNARNRWMMHDFCNVSFAVPTLFIMWGLITASAGLITTTCAMELFFPTFNVIHHYCLYLYCVLVCIVFYCVLCIVYYCVMCTSSVWGMEDKCINLYACFQYRF